MNNDTVEKAIQYIIEKPLHTREETTNSSEADTLPGKFEENDARFTYFDDLQGNSYLQNQILDPILKRYKDEIISSNTSILVSAKRFFIAYPSLRNTIIDPLLSTKIKLSGEANHNEESDIHRMENLLSYEIFLSMLVSDSKKDFVCHRPDKSSQSDSILHSIYDIVHLLASDIKMATKLIIDGRKTRTSTNLLGLLIRCLTHAMNTVSIDCDQTRNSPTNKMFEGISFATLTACALLPYDKRVSEKLGVDFSTATPNSISAKEILTKEILSKFELRTLLDTCAFPPDTTVFSTIASNGQNGMKFRNSVINIDNVPTNEAIWLKSDVIRRAAQRLLQSIGICVKNFSKHSTNKGESQFEIMKQIEEFLGQEHISRSCRKFFFDKSTNSVIQKNENLQSEPYFYPSHVHGSLSLLTSLSFPLNRSSLHQILPICYALLDHRNSYYQNIGAALLLRMMHITTPTELFEHWINIENITQGVWKSGCCDNVYNMALLTLIRTDLTGILKDHDTSTNLPFDEKSPFMSSSNSIAISISAKRREFSLDLFLFLKKKIYLREKRGYEDSNSNPNENEDMILPILVCGICPLLAQHVSLGTREGPRRRDSDAMEISTDGIHAFLLLLESLEWEIAHGNANDETLWFIPITTILALISFFMCTYPAMKCHGGKIMCALLSSLGNCHKNIHKYESRKEPLEYADMFLNITVHAASMAMILCGKHAANAMKEVEEKCIDSMSNFCREIREKADLLLQEGI